MTTALAVLGPYLRSLPDGETGERRDWIKSSITGLRSHPDLEPNKLSDQSNQDQDSRLRVRKGHRLFGAALDFGHVAAAGDIYPVFEDLAAGHEDLVFQQGVPGALDMAALTLGPTAGLRHLGAFAEATLAEIRDVRTRTGPSTLFQLELPLELVLVARAPAPMRRPLARLLARNVARLAAAAPHGTRFAVHLCVGDYKHRALTTPTDVAALVVLTNELVVRWPTHNPLVLVHAPFAAAEQPASTEASFLAPLRQLQVPAETAFAAGFAHEAQPLDVQLQIRDRTEALLGREVVIAAACGLGRRPDAGGTAVLERMAQLCTAR